MRIKKINIICHSHYDMNGVDHPTVASVINKKIINKAIEFIDKYKTNPKGEQFCWTIEASAPLMEWWSDASPDNRRKLIESVESGHLEVCGLPYNMTAAISEEEVNKVTNWMPDEIFDGLKIRTVIQSGVDGISASAINRLKSRGVRYVWSIPAPNGNFLRAYPFAFNWKLTTSSRVLAFQNGAKGSFSEMMLGYPLEEQYIKSADTYCNLSDGCRLFNFDDDDIERKKRFVAECYVRLSEYVDKLEKGGEYQFSILPVSLSGRVRGFNELPIEDLVEFIRLWNEMEFRPALCISTAGSAFREMEIEAAAAAIPTFSGQWPDSFARKYMSMPLEVSAARKTARTYSQIKRIKGQCFGEEKTKELIMRDVASFYEHNIEGISEDSISFTTAKAAPVYRALARAEYLLAEKIKDSIDYDKEGIYVYNPTDCALSGLIEFPEKALKGDYVSVMERDTLAIQSLHVRKAEGGNNVASFWANVPARSYRYYALMTLASPESAYVDMPETETDMNGWPLKFRYKDGSVLTTSGLCDVMSVCPRDDGSMDSDGCEYSLALTSEYDTYATVVQSFDSEVIGAGTRIMTVWKEEPRVNVKIIIEQKQTKKPAAVYAKVSLNMSNGFPITSSGGLVFDPSRSIIYGSVLDNIPFDGWISYPYVKTVLIARDTPLVSFGSHNLGYNSKDFTADKGEVYFLLVDNTNLKSSVTGQSERLTYSFDIVYDENADDFAGLAKLAQKCSSEFIPVVYVK